MVWTKKKKYLWKKFRLVQVKRINMQKFKWDSNLKIHFGKVRK